MILGDVHRSPGIGFIAEEKPKKPQLGDRLMKGCATSHRLKWGLLPQNEASRAAQNVRKGYERKEGMTGNMIRILLSHYNIFSKYIPYPYWTI